MPPSFVTLLVLAFLGFQAWLLARALRDRGLCRLERILGAWLLLWLALVLGGGLCAAFSRIGDARWYFGANIAVTAALLLALRLTRTAASSSGDAGPLFPPWEPRSRWDRGVMLAGLGAVAGGFVIVSLIGWWHGPTIDDCLACKLPRTAFFARHGNLLPPDGWNNPRIFGAPPYCSMLQLPFFVSASDVASSNLLGSASWLLMAGAVYLAGRFCGASPPAALFSAAAFNGAALILQKGSSENDDLLAALPTVLAGYFFVTGSRSPGSIRYSLAGVAFGLSLGGKLIALYLAIPIALWSLWRLVRGPNRSHLWRGSLAFTAAILVTASVFFAQNWRMYRFPLPRTELIAINRNAPFHAGTFAYTLAGQSLACLASPVINVAALLEWSGLAGRDSLNATVSSVDSFLGRLVLDRIPHHPAPFSGEFSVAPFALRQTFDPMRELNESNNSFGILGIALLGSALIAGRAGAGGAWVFASLGLVGFIQYCATFKFILQTTRYFTPFVALAMPLLALAADRCRRGGSRFAARALCAITAAYTLAFIMPAWWHGRDRSIQRLAQQPGRAPLPVDEQTSAELARLLRNEPALNVMDSYEVPFLPLLERSRGRQLVVNNFSSTRPPLLVGTFWNVDAVTAAGFGGMLWPVPADATLRGVTFTPVGAGPISHFFFREQTADDRPGVMLVRLSARDPGNQPAEVSASLFSVPGSATDDLELAIGSAEAPPASLRWQPASREQKTPAGSGGMMIHLRRKGSPDQVRSARIPLREWFDPFLPSPP